MPTVVGISFRPVTKGAISTRTVLWALRPGEYVVVDTACGREVGCVIMPPGDVSTAELSGGLKHVGAL